MKRALLLIIVGALYVLHQDFWFWRAARPLVLGFIPIGLFYHACYAVATAAVMVLLVRQAWPSHLEEGGDEGGGDEATGRGGDGARGRQGEGARGTPGEGGQGEGATGRLEKGQTIRPLAPSPTPPLAHSPTPPLAPLPRLPLASSGEGAER